MYVSHDAAGNASTLLTFDDVLSAWQSCGTPGMLAVNTKEDGLAPELRRKVCTSLDSKWLCFDQSVPDLRSYLTLGIPTLARVSDWEPEPYWYERCQGVWLDAFDDDLWWLDGDLERWLQHGVVAVVSPELHGRPALDTWRRLRRFAQNPHILLCTDRVDAAVEYFA